MLLSAYVVDFVALGGAFRVSLAPDGLSLIFEHIFTLLDSIQIDLLNIVELSLRLSILHGVNPAPICTLIQGAGFYRNCTRTAAIRAFKMVPIAVITTLITFSAAVLVVPMLGGGLRMSELLYAGYII